MAGCFSETRIDPLIINGQTFLRFVSYIRKLVVKSNVLWRVLQSIGLQDSFWSIIMYLWFFKNIFVTSNLDIKHECFTCFQSMTFKKSSKGLARAMCMKNAKITIILVIVIIVSLNGNHFLIIVDKTDP